MKKQQRHSITCNTCYSFSCIMRFSCSCALVCSLVTDYANVTQHKLSKQTHVQAHACTCIYLPTQTGRQEDKHARTQVGRQTVRQRDRQHACTHRQTNGWTDRQVVKQADYVCMHLCMYVCMYVLRRYSIGWQLIVHNTGSNENAILSFFLLSVFACLPVSLSLPPVTILLQDWFSASPISSKCKSTSK